MKYSDYSFSASTQASFYKAEAEIFRLNNRLAHSSYARFLKNALLAIDGLFAIRISKDVKLSAVSLIAAFDLLNRKYPSESNQSIHLNYKKFLFSDKEYDSVKQALNYMQTMDWISRNFHADTAITIETVLQIHEHLLAGLSNDNRYHGFRRTFLPHRKGFDLADIPLAVNDLCKFINIESFSPLGQASVINHVFERIVPFDNLIDRTGLALAFLSLFKRDLFSSGFIVPICWGTAESREYRKYLRDNSRIENNIEQYIKSRESWAVLNARNTYLSAIIANSFLDAAYELCTKWRSDKVHIPVNSALDKIFDLLLGHPMISTKRASILIDKSYGATNEAMRQLSNVGIVREIAIDNRERLFICDESSAMITRFVNKLITIEHEMSLARDQKEKIIRAVSDITK